MFKNIYIYNIYLSTYVSWKMMFLSNCRISFNILALFWGGCDSTGWLHHKKSQFEGNQTHSHFDKNAAKMVGELL